MFNEPNNGFDILVASDAVGMGLNLNIRRVIFHKVQKFEGSNSVPVSASQIKQIAGEQHTLPCILQNTTPCGITHGALSSAARGPAAMHHSMFWSMSGCT